MRLLDISAALQFRKQVLWRFDKKTRAAFKLIRPGSVCVDVGANVGVVSREFLARGAIVHAVEPNPWAFESLHRVAEKNGKFFAYQAAASLDTQPLPLFESPWV